MKKFRYWILTAVTVLSLTIAGTAGLYLYARSHLIYEDEPVLFGATYMTMNNQFYDVIDEELRNLVEADGNTMITMDPQLSLERQIAEIEEMMNRGIQVLIVNPVDSIGLEYVLKRASDRGIIVIAIDTSIYDGEDYVDYTVVSDNYEAGVLCAEQMMAKQSSAEILLLTHASASSAVERIQGFCDTIEGHDAYRIVAEEECEGQMEKSMPAVENVINRGISFDTVMALNDPAAIGAIAAIKEYSLSSDQISVYGVDGTPEAKVLIKDGYMEGTVAQSPKLMAQKAVSTARQLLEGERDLPDERIPVEMIDRSNIDEFILEGWQ